MKTSDQKDYGQFTRVDKYAITVTLNFLFFIVIYFVNECVRGIARTFFLVKAASS